MILVLFVWFRDRLVGVSSQRPHPSDEVLDISKREAVMATAGECVRREERERVRRERREERERRRRENRIELVKQLEEVELEEKKDRSKVHTQQFLSGQRFVFSSKANFLC